MNKTQEYWYNLNIEFKDSFDVPRLNLFGEDYLKYVIPALIRCGAIQKENLRDGVEYYGSYRSSDSGVWDKSKNKFIIKRVKFGTEFNDFCNHFEDDDGYALFVPIKLKSELV